MSTRQEAETIYKSSDAIDKIERLIKDRDRFGEMLEQLMDYFADREDVIDGPEGAQLPNQEMQLASEIRKALDST